MMTDERLGQIIATYIRLEDQRNWNADYRQVALKLLDELIKEARKESKQTPREVRPCDYCTDYSVTCPACHKEIAMDEESGYCCYCGQALIWDEYVGDKEGGKT